MAWRHLFAELCKEGRGEIPPEMDSLHRDCIGHILLERRLASLSVEDLRRGLSAVEDLLPVLPARTVKAMEKLLLGKESSPQQRREGLPSEEGLEGLFVEVLGGPSGEERIKALSVTDLLTALSPETLMAFLSQRK